MKSHLIGYVTGMVNNYQLTLKVMEANKYNDSTLLAMQNKLIGNTTDLLDYIADFKEIEPKENIDNYLIYVKRITELEDENKLLIKGNENQKFTIQARQNNASEIQELKKRLAEANESVESLKDNEKRLKESMRQSEAIFEVLGKAKRTAFRNYRDKVQATQKCNEELKATNVMWQTSCNNLKLQLEKLQGPQWKE